MASHNSIAIHSHPDALLLEAANPIRIPKYRRYESWEDWYKAPELDGNRVLPLVRNGSLPLFIGIGQQKAGTTYFRNLLNTHPMLTSGEGNNKKCGAETHFFDEIGCSRIRYQSEVAAFAAKYSHDHFSFPTCHGHASSFGKRDYRQVPGLWDIVSKKHTNMETEQKEEGRLDSKLADGPVFFFDVTPNYVMLGRAWSEMMLKVLGENTLLVLLLRDPVERYLSSLRMSGCDLKLHESKKDWNDSSNRNAMFPPKGQMSSLISECEHLENYSSSSEGWKREGASSGPWQSGYDTELSLDWEPRKGRTDGRGCKAEPAMVSRAILRGRYQLLVRRLLAVFPREQLHVIRSEDLYSNPDKVMRKLLERLGLPLAGFMYDEVQHYGSRSGSCNVTGQLIDETDIKSLRGYYRAKGDLDLREILKDESVEWLS